MVNPRVHTNFVENNDASFLNFSFQLPHCGRDITGCDYIGLAFNRGFNDFCVIHVWDERDDDIMGSNLGFKLGS